MAHEERDRDVDAWQPRTTRSRGEREGARVRSFWRAQQTDRSMFSRVHLVLLKYLDLYSISQLIYLYH